MYLIADYIGLLKMKKLLCWLLLLSLFLVGCSSSYVTVTNGTETINVRVKIADDNNERTNGLMFRKHLDEDEGMFFIFPESRKRVFWMKNTFIPLDIIFISDDSKIIHIAEAEPCKSDPCYLYESQGNAQYVLEVNKGFSKKYNITVGDRVFLL